LSTKPFGLLEEFAFGFLAFALFGDRVFFGLLDARGFGFGFDLGFGFERVLVCAISAAPLYLGPVL
jgi:hypothetical protein